MLLFLAGFQLFFSHGNICLNEDLRLCILVPFLKTNMFTFFFNIHI